MQAQELIRGLTEQIVLTPVDGRLQVEMTGDLAAMPINALMLRQAIQA